MVLLSLVGIGLGLYGAKKVMEEPLQWQRESYIKNERSNADINQICDYMSIKKHDGVYSIDDFEHIAKILRTQFYFKENEIEQVRKNFMEQVGNQLVTKTDNINKRYDKLHRYYVNTGYGVKEDYYEVRHWHHLSRQKHEERIFNIYHNTYWNKVAIEPPYLIEDSNTNGYIEVWHITKAPLMNMDKHYDIALKKLGYK